MASASKTANIKSKRSKAPKPKGKLSSMKTAALVVKRFLNDTDVPRHFISVGYIDRFLGVIEKPFAAFCWDDYTSQDIFTFGVPEHRIQYFKYKKAVVWDKTKRLDNVFGSTGSGTTIRDVIANYREEDFSNDDSQRGKSDSEDVESDIYSEDDDDFNINCDGHESKNFAGAVNAGLDEDETGYNSDEYWMDKMRPNYFICQKITDTEIIKNCEEVIDHVVRQEPLYESCSQKSNLLHMTLCTLRLETQEEVAELIELLDKNMSEIKQSVPQAQLRVKGVDRFFGRVLYASVEHSKELNDFIDTLNSILRTEGIRIMDNHNFVPHISLIKVSRQVTRQLGHRNINPRLFNGYDDFDFGSFKISSFHLCEMGQRRTEDGDYIKFCHFNLK